MRKKCKTYSVSPKSPLKFSYIFPKRSGIFIPNITRLSTLYYKLLFNYLQLWRSYAILTATTQFITYVQNVHHWPTRTLAFSDIFSKPLGIFSPNFTRPLHDPVYARIQICIQLSSTLTVLKCDHPARVSADGGHFEHMTVVALNTA